MEMDRKGCTLATLASPLLVRLSFCLVFFTFFTFFVEQAYGFLKLKLLVVLKYHIYLPLRIRKSPFNQMRLNLTDSRIEEIFFVLSDIGSKIKINNSKISINGKDASRLDRTDFMEQAELYLNLARDTVRYTEESKICS